MRLKSIGITAATLLAATTVFGETFSWRHESSQSSSTPPANPNWQSFGTADSWAVGTRYDGTNPDAIVPGADDYIHYGTSDNYKTRVKAFDLDGHPYAVKGFPSGLLDWVPYLFLLRNGTLAFTAAFTNRAAHVHVYGTGRFVLGEGCSSRCGGGSIFTRIKVYAGGAADIGGEMHMDLLRMEVDSGGALTFSPSMLEFVNTADKDNGPSYIRNYGTLAIPKGVDLKGYSGDRPCVFSVEQHAGTLTLGGNIKNSQYGDVLDFVLAGGTVNVTNDVSFSRVRNLVMTNDASVVVEVSEGKTLDLTAMTFREGTSLTKRGLGTLKLGGNAPENMAVEGGTLAVSGAASFDGGISVAAGAVLNILSTGVSFGTVSFEEGASVVFDPSLTAGVGPLFSCSDSAALATAAQHLGSAPQGYAYLADGTTLYLDKPHAASVFYWKKENSASYWSFFDSSCWGVGKTADAANANGLVPGADDDIYYGNAYQRYMYFDMKGAHRTVKGLADSLTAQEKWGFCYITVKNGALEFSSCFTNVRALVTVKADGRFVLGENCGTLAGYDGAQNTYTVESGGACDIGGNLCMHVFQATVQSGGHMAFRPSTFTYHGGVYASNPQSFIRNAGALEIPGFTLDGKSGGGPCVFTIEQNAGSLTLGGSLAMADADDYADFVLAGGTVNVVNDTAFVGFHKVLMTNDATVAVNVAEGQTFDLSMMTCEDDTTMSKTGSGTLKVGASVPRTLDTQGGTLTIAGAAAFGEGLSLGTGTELHFAKAGTTAGGISGIADAVVTIDPESVGFGSAIITSTNATLIATVAEKLAPAIAAARKPRLALAVETTGGETATHILRLVRIPTGIVLSFK